MTSETNSTPTQALLTDVSLEKEYFELSSAKIQFLWMTFILFVVCLINYLPTLRCGLAQSDFQRVGIVIQATHGQWHDFLQSLQFLDLGNLYKPVGSASLLLDRVIWHSNYAGFHFTNILILFACACFIMLITLEITGTWGNRSRSAALWAGLLFAVYPLHAQAVTSLSCRDDLLTGLFFLLSLFCFLRFRLLRERLYQRWFFLFFALLVLESKSALVLPVVMLLSVPLLPSQLQGANARILRKYRAQDCSLAVACCLVPFACLVYKFKLFEMGVDFNNLAAWAQTFALPTILDPESFKRMLLPVNAQLQWPRVFPILLICPLILAAVSCILRLTRECSLIRALILLFLWLLLGLLPSWDHWHIYRNLVGSNLFFSSSAPLCAAVAIASIPSADVLSRKVANWLTCFGAPALAILFFAWSYALQQNITPFVVAAEILHKSALELHKISSAAPPNRGIVVLDLPHDYKGAPLFTSESLKLSVEPPFNPYKDTVSVIDTLLGGKSDYLWPDEIKRALKTADAFCWSEAKQSFVSLTTVAGKSHPAVVDNYMAATLDPPNAWSGSDRQWHLGAPQNPGFETYPTYRRLIPAMAKAGRKAPPVMTIMIPVSNIDPFDKTVALLNINFHGSDVDRQKCQFVWRSRNPGDAQTSLHQATIDKNLVWLGHYKRWLLNGEPTSIGFRLEPGNYCVDVGAIQLMDDASLKPVLLVDNQVFAPAQVLPYSENLKSKFSWQARRVHDCQSVMLVISDPDTPASTKGDGTAYSGKIASESRHVSKDGTVQLPDLNIPEGLSQIQVIALDAKGQRIGLPSEPVTIFR